MADNNPNVPGGGVPPGSKIQPKKETVRINLPPKPSAAPTIKLPTLPPGGPSAGAPAQMAPPPPTATAPAAPLRSGAAPVAAQPQQRPIQRPLAPPVAAISGLDKGLAIGAAVAALIAVGSTVYCMMLFN
jgi:hypothetical protein